MVVVMDRVRCSLLVRLFAALSKLHLRPLFDAYYLTDVSGQGFRLAYEIQTIATTMTSMHASIGVEVLCVFLNIIALSL